MGRCRLGSAVDCRPEAANRFALSERESRWADGKSTLRVDRGFLQEWLELLMRWRAFEPYKQDIAKVNMLRDLLGLK